MGYRFDIGRGTEGSRGEKLCEGHREGELRGENDGLGQKRDGGEGGRTREGEGRERERGVGVRKGGKE